MKDLTTGEAAELLNVAPVTVRLWCRQGKFPNAYSEDTPRGVVWYIPRGDLNGVDLSRLAILGFNLCVKAFNQSLSCCLAFLHSSSGRVDGQDIQIEIFPHALTLDHFGNAEKRAVSLRRSSQRLPPLWQPRRPYRPRRPRPRSTDDDSRAAGPPRSGHRRADGVDLRRPTVFRGTLEQVLAAEAECRRGGVATDPPWTAAILSATDATQASWNGRNRSL